jgi:hypothetical protein
MGCCITDSNGVGPRGETAAAFQFLSITSCVERNWNNIIYSPPSADANLRDSGLRTHSSVPRTTPKNYSVRNYLSPLDYMQNFCIICCNKRKRVARLCAIERRKEIGSCSNSRHTLRTFESRAESTAAVKREPTQRAVRSSSSPVYIICVKICSHNQQLSLRMRLDCSRLICSFNSGWLTLALICIESECENRFESKKHETATIT